MLQANFLCAETRSRHILERAQNVVGPDLLSREIQLSPSFFLKSRLKGKKVRYDGEVAVVAHDLTADQLLPAFPPAGTTGRHLLEDGASPELSCFLSDPERCRKPAAEMERPLPSPRVMASDAGWSKIDAFLVDLSVREVVPDSDVPWFEGEEISHGCFGVIRPNKFLPGGRVVLQIDHGRQKDNLALPRHQGGSSSCGRSTILSPSCGFVV